MKSDSPLFDRIRVKPDKDRRLRGQCPACEWPDCAAAATHRAPKGRLREREYWRFCLEHVREYNHAYNFFAGMSTEDIARYQKEAVVGHRPTWKMGMSGGPPVRAPTPPGLIPNSLTSVIHSGFSGSSAQQVFQGARPGAARQNPARCAMPNAKRSTRSGSRRTPPRKTSKRGSRRL